MEINKTDFDFKIETLLYFKHGLLSVKEYLDFISENKDNIASIKFCGDYFKIKSIVIGNLILKYINHKNI